MAYLLSQIKQPAVIITPTTMIRRQRRDTLRAFFHEEDVLEIEGNQDIKEKILIMTHQTFNLIYDKVKHFPVLVIDEVHRFNETRRDQINMRENKYLVL